MASLLGTILAGIIGIAPGGTASLVTGIVLPIAILAFAARRSDWERAP